MNDNRPHHDSGSEDEPSLEQIYTDGGNVDAAPFRIKADSTVTRKERWKRRLDIYLLTPIRIMAHDWRALLGSAIVIFYLLVGFVGPLVVEPTRTGDGPHTLGMFVDWNYPLGTDPLGHDLFAQAIYSTLPILQMMAAGGLFTVTLGTTVGMIAGYKGGAIDTLLSTLTDIFLNIPGLPLVVVLATLVRPENPYWIGILLTVAAWAGLARAIRSQVLTLRGAEFTEASRTLGLSNNTIVFKEILPHLMPYVMINMVGAMRGVVFAAVGLYFIGVLPFADRNWGVMLNEAFSEGAYYRPELIHWLIVPLVAIVGISMGFILLAQSLDRIFNPRIRARHMDTEGDEPIQDEEIDIDAEDTIESV